MEKEEQYEGWANRETWLVNLHLENDYYSYTFWTEQAERRTYEAPNCDQVAVGVWTPAQAAKFNLSKQLEEMLSDTSKIDLVTLYDDLLSTALSRVQWDEIAEHWLQKE